MYYDALYDSQINWHEGKDDPTPFIKYMLMTILFAYNDFEERLSLVSKKKSATELVESAFEIKIMSDHLTLLFTVKPAKKMP